MKDSQALLIAGSIVLSGGIVAIGVHPDGGVWVGVAGVLIGLLMLAHSSDRRKREQKEPPAGHKG